MSDELRLDGRVAVVTGAGRGIGRSHALLLASRGAQVIVNDLGGTTQGSASSAAPADSVVAEIRAAGGEAAPSYVDISTPAGGESVVAAALDNFGSIDIVVNNAGIYTRPRSFLETSLELFERQWRVHFGGCYNVTRAAWPLMLQQGYGRIVLTGSSAGFYGMPSSVEYSSAKGAVNGLLFALAHEAQGHGIKVNGIGPAGYTRMVEGLFPDAASDKLIREQFKPELSSPLVVWLAHEQCDVNGHFYQAHGGRVARVVSGESAGHWDLDPSPESVVAGLSEARDLSDVQYPSDAATWAGWVAGNGAARSQTAKV